MLELRATTSLSQLLRRRERLLEARECMEHVCAGVAEGFGTADLQESKALIDELQVG